MIEIEPAPGRISLVATLDSGRPGPTLAVNGHLDVVPAGPLDAWEHPPYEAVVADGMLHDRGSCDMKGAIAAVHLNAFEVASAVDPDAPTERAATAALRDLDLSAEPIGMAGATDARILDEAGIPAIVFGPGDLALSHSTAEHIPVADLTIAARAFARMFAAYLAPA